MFSLFPCLVLGEKLEHSVSQLLPACHTAVFFNFGGDSDDNVHRSLGLLGILMAQIVGLFAHFDFLCDVSRLTAKICPALARPTTKS